MNEPIDARTFVYRYSKRRLLGFVAMCIFVGVSYHWMLGFGLISGVPLCLLAYTAWDRIKLGQNKLLLVFAYLTLFIFVLPGLFGFLTNTFDNQVGSGRIDAIVMTGLSAMGFALILALGFGNMRPHDLNPFHRNPRN